MSSSFSIVLVLTFLLISYSIQGESIWDEEDHEDHGGRPMMDNSVADTSISDYSSSSSDDSSDDDEDDEGAAVVGEPSFAATPTDNTSSAEDIPPPPPPVQTRRHLHHRKSDNESSQVDSGIWQVFNSTANRDGHSHAPSCILASLMVSLVVPVQDEDGIVTNKTIVVPKNATARGQCGERQQWLTLVWNNTHDSGKLVKTAELTLLFTKIDEDDAIYLTHVWASIALFLEDNSAQSIIDRTLPSQDIIMVLKEEQLWKTPIRFAYVCHHREEIKLHANTLPVQSAPASASGDIMIVVDPIFNEDAYLVFHDLHVETFRRNRFGRHFTHLNYDCHDKWAYSYMPPVVGSALGLLVAVMVVAFIFRRQIGCAPVMDSCDANNNGEKGRVVIDVGEDDDRACKTGAPIAEGEDISEEEEDEDEEADDEKSGESNGIAGSSSSRRGYGSVAQKEGGV